MNKVKAAPWLEGSWRCPQFTARPPELARAEYINIRDATRAPKLAMPTRNQARQAGKDDLLGFDVPTAADQLKSVAKLSTLPAGLVWCK
jgi:hypothetical protein